MKKTTRIPSVATRLKEKEIEDLESKTLTEKIYCLARVLSLDTPAFEALSESRKSILQEDNKEYVELKLMALIKKL